MNLYINTSGQHCELALLDKSNLIAHRVHEEPMQHSTVLHTLLDEILAENNTSFEYLKSIAMLNGPGSYTGLRIGLAAAKGICYATNTALILLNKLEVLGQFYLANNPTENLVASIEPARTGEYFFALRDRNKILIEPNVQTLEFIVQELSNRAAKTALISSSIIAEGEINAEISQISPDLSFIGQEIHNRLINNDLNNLFKSEPFYLKNVHANKPKKRF